MHNQQITVTIETPNGPIETPVVFDWVIEDEKGIPKAALLRIDDGVVETFELAADAVVTPVYGIPSANLGKLEERFKTLEKKAKKLSCSIPTYTVLGEDYQDKRSSDEIELGAPPRWKKITYITVEGDAPKHEGWSFIGTIESATEALAKGMYMLNMVPGQESPARFRRRDAVDPCYCDYCKTNRYRKATFLVQHENGEVRQVGRSCIKDFTGHKDPAAVASYLQWLDDLVRALDDEESDFYGGSSYSEYIYTLLDYLAVVRCVIRHNGWVSRGAAGWNEIPTADIAWGVMIPAIGRKAIESQREWLARLEDTDREYAKACLEFLPSLWDGKDPETLSGYIFNLQAATSANMVTRKTSGIAASALSVYARHLEEEIKREAQKQINEHVGTPGEVLEAKVTVIQAKWIEGMYGSRCLLKFVDTEGHTIVWWYSGQNEYEVGERYRLSAKVDRHGKYKGLAETNVKRATLTRLDVVYVKLTKAQAKLVDAQDIDSWFETRDGRRPTVMGLAGDLLCIPVEDVEAARGLVRFLQEQGRVGKGAVKKIAAAWDAEEMGELEPAAAEAA